ncbi:hypothetical protein RND81_09G017100 [Saponaria officinalis]|uniref:Small ribosomal subunit protein bS20c n=1 Tax=Saponaria officinalis TaxID=3572 RepID=A0AAW1IHL0_SAPOF
MAAISMACISTQTLSLSSSFKSLSISSSSSSTLSSNSVNLSHSFFSHGYPSLTSTRRPQSFSVVCEVATQKKADSAVKRARQAETRRLRNKARKSEVRTRMRKVMDALDVLKKKTGAVPEEIIPIETLIAEAYSAIDKAVGKGTLHRNTGANRKSRLARNKKTVEIHHGWYTPAPDPTAA